MNKKRKYVKFIVFENVEAGQYETQSNMCEKQELLIDSQSRV